MAQISNVERYNLEAELIKDVRTNGVSAEAIEFYRRQGLHDAERIARKAMVDPQNPRLVRTTDLDRQQFQPIPEMSDNLVNGVSALYQALKANPRLTRNEQRTILEEHQLTGHAALIAIKTAHEYRGEEGAPSSDKPNTSGAASITV